MWDKYTHNPTKAWAIHMMVGKQKCRGGWVKVAAPSAQEAERIALAWVRTNRSFVDQYGVSISLDNARVIKVTPAASHAGKGVFEVGKMWVRISCRSGRPTGMTHRLL